ncbi:hypothetical protein GWK47_042501 [Chionoecetes opilio]|uniref:Uncharacterized protein n=1 Tax=Chionoecetes opilio TaxID=41210 RepID=A0A8J5D036_CHIOP|nr:hypothetical protein GWK47_042501 [Chionoecetes opilio]
MRIRGLEESLVKDACYYVADLASLPAHLRCVRQNVLGAQPSTKPAAAPHDPFRGQTLLLSPLLSLYQQEGEPGHAHPACAWSKQSLASPVERGPVREEREGVNPSCISLHWLRDSCQKELHRCLGFLEVHSCWLLGEWVSDSRGFRNEDMGTEIVPFCRGMLGVLVTLFSATCVGKHSKGAVGDGSWIAICYSTLERSLTSVPSALTALTKKTTCGCTYAPGTKSGSLPLAEPEFRRPAAKTWIFKITWVLA